MENKVVPDGNPDPNEATQPPLTPESVTPPAEPPQTKPAVKNRYAIPEVILPPEDKPLLPREEARRKRREDYLRNGS